MDTDVTATRSSTIDGRPVRGRQDLTTLCGGQATVIKI
jgi:hypothetical protein